MDHDDVFSRDPEVMAGALVFRGTRVPVEALFENLADGMSLDAFVENYPTVERSQAENAILLALADVKREAA